MKKNAICKKTDETHISTPGELENYLTDKDFAVLMGGALESRTEDIYIAEWATSSIFDPDADAPAPDYDAVIALLRSIYRAAHVTIREIREYTGLTQAAFSDRFFIPRRTVQSWELGERQCPDYVRIMLAQLTGAATIH